MTSLQAGSWYAHLLFKVPVITLLAVSGSAQEQANGIDSINALPRPTKVYEKLDESRVVDVVNI